MLDGYIRRDAMPQIGDVAEAPEGVQHLVGALPDDRNRRMQPGGIQVSLERNMKCGIGLCGHCQLGPLLLCRDGPVVSWSQAEPLLAVREL